MCNNPLNRIEGHIIEQRELSPGIFDMIVWVGDRVKEAKPGQFINLYSKSAALLLPRPISICEVNIPNKSFRLVFAVVGNGTKEFSHLVEGDSIEVLGPFGNGFTLPMNHPLNHLKHVLIIGGGVGTPPLLELAKTLKSQHKDNIELTIVLGFRDVSYLGDEFAEFGTVYISTDSGKEGFSGNVVDLMNEKQIIETTKFDYVYACGPTPMLRSIQRFALLHGLNGEFSLEERMGCGFGGCVGCVVPIRKNLQDDTDLEFEYKKVCKDGPIFNYKEVIFE